MPVKIIYNLQWVGATCSVGVQLVSEKQPPVISEIRLIVSSLIRNQGIGYERLRISLVKIGKIGRTMT